MQFTHFALIQTGQCVFGVGETAEAARADAVEWVDGGDISNVPVFRNLGALRTQTVVGDLAIVPCTAAFAARVRENGTQVWDETNEGICLPSELK